MEQVSRALIREANRLTELLRYIERYLRGLSERARRERDHRGRSQDFPRHYERAIAPAARYCCCQPCEASVEPELGSALIALRDRVGAERPRDAR